MTRRIVLASLTVAAMAAAPVVGAQSGPPAPSNALEAPSGNVLLFKTLATGTQIYVCAPRADDPGAFAWTFKAPEAELWNDLGEQIGTHYAGPSWEGNDGSTVVGEVVARADAPDASAIPWLLLRAKSNGGAGVQHRYLHPAAGHGWRRRSHGGLRPVGRRCHACGAVSGGVRVLLRRGAVTRSGR